MSKWRTLATSLVGAFGASEVAGVSASLIYTCDLETAGAGAVVPLSTLPAIVLYLLFGLLKPHLLWKDIAFAAPTVGLVAWLLHVIRYSSPQAYSEGVDEMARYLMVVFVTASAAAYGSLIALHRASDSSTNPQDHVCGCNK